MEKSRTFSWSFLFMFSLVPLLSLSVEYASREVLRLGLRVKTLCKKGEAEVRRFRTHNRLMMSIANPLNLGEPFKHQNLYHMKVQ